MVDFNLGLGLVIRPSTPSDAPFFEQLHSSTQDDLRLIDGDRELVESVIEMQFKAQTQGYGAQFPNAMYFVVEKQQQAIGKVTIDFGANEVRVIDIAFIPAARGKGFGEEVLRCLQTAAERVRTPLTLTVASNNPIARNLYLKLGFIVQDRSPPYEFLVWYPASKRAAG